jgi:dTMP kinase
MNAIATLKSPLLITFEGIDGSGKSTLARKTVDALEDAALPVLFLAEPTRGETGMRIRKLLSSPIPPDPDLMLRLFIEDREQDVAENIRPALTEKKIVVIDRYYHSNAAYQGASGLSYKRILRSNIERGFPVPDRVFLFDIDPRSALERIRKRLAESMDQADVFEKESFLSDVATIYKELGDQSFCVLDAELTPDELLEMILRNLSESFADA